ncbi:hypothetical protein [Candidatus Protochlamydia phocaeensis]|uniref:hypothetical protein n=1 Tax=Candidatus Protochlamydia phocaeensis TaxID=1414722 RepID=UPI000839430A|nr:hypothetical protein [Candidatus Protochlamydia phocaeensis]
MDPGLISRTGGTEQVSSYADSSSLAEAMKRPDVSTRDSKEPTAYASEALSQEPTLTPQQQCDQITSVKARESLAAYQSARVSIGEGEHHFTSWTQVISAEMFHLAERVAKAEEKTLLWLLEQDRQRKYLLHCWRNLEREFHLLLKNIQSGSNF